MKTPRINDFDPNAKVQPLKSPLDGMPEIGKPQQKSKAPVSPPLPEKPVLQEAQEKAATPNPRPPAPVKQQQREPMETPTAAAQGFDLNLPTEKSHTFAFTFEEWLAMEELKTGLSRLLGLDPRITKIDIIRSALQLIVEDYRKRGEESFIVARIKTKKSVDRIRTKKVR
jgi:hypothetical protein